MTITNWLWPLSIAYSHRQLVIVLIAIGDSYKQLKMATGNWWWLW